VNCPFCSEIKNPSIVREVISDWPYPDRFLYENKAWVVVPGYSPQVYPYILTISKRHIKSFLEATKKERDMFYDCLDHLLMLDVFKEKKICFFEHGGNACGASCLDHCHLHLIDTEYRLLDDFEGSGGDFYYYDKDEKTYDGINYLLCGEYFGKNDFVVLISRVVEREHQYFRHMLAEKIGDSRWDWHMGINKKYMLDLYQEVMGLKGLI